jgi:hypothetical protein
MFVPATSRTSPQPRRGSIITVRTAADPSMTSVNAIVSFTPATMTHCLDRHNFLERR